MQIWQIVGMGNLGARYAEAAEAAGATVLTHTRDTTPIPATDPAQTTVVVAVPETLLPVAIARVPQSLRDVVVLVQNDVFLPDAIEAGVRNPTFAVVWSQHKQGLPTIVGRPTGVWGPRADAVLALHEHLDIDAQALEGATEPDTELVAKWTFLLTINALGARFGGSIAEARQAAGALGDAVVEDAIRIALWRSQAGCRAGVDHAAVEARVHEAFASMAEMTAAGRTASRRVDEALMCAVRAGIVVPGLTQVAVRR